MSVTMIVVGWKEPPSDAPSDILEYLGYDPNVTDEIFSTRPELFSYSTKVKDAFIKVIRIKHDTLHSDRVSFIFRGIWKGLEDLPDELSIRRRSTFISEVFKEYLLRVMSPSGFGQTNVTYGDDFVISVLGVIEQTNAELTLSNRAAIRDLNKE